MSMATAVPDAETVMVPGGLLLRIGPPLRLSEDDFWHLCQANPDLNLERTAEGDVVIMPPAGADGDRRNVWVVAQLLSWNDAHNLGEVFGQSAGFTLPSGAVVGPDAAWIARDRWEALPVADRRRFTHICPDFVVEVVSPSQTPAGLRPRMRQYLDEGTRLAWLIDPWRKLVEVHRPGRPIETLDAPATPSGEDVLPGFVLDLARVFGP